MSKQPNVGEREVRTMPTTEFRIATAEDGSRTLSGLVPYNSPSCDLGGFTELIAPSAFAGALMPGADVLCFRDHKPEILLGRTKSKTLVLTDAPEGLRFSCKLPKTTQASDLAESVDRGDLDANSFGFIMLDDSWLADEAGNVVRTLLSVDLIELSPCSLPAYPASQVSVRSCPDELRSKMIKSKMSKCTDPNVNGCGCNCPECVDGSCVDCTDSNCTDPNCQAERSLRHSAKVLAQRVKVARAHLD